MFECAHEIWNEAQECSNVRMKHKKLEVESENVKREVLAPQKNESRQDDLDKTILCHFDEVHVRSYNKDMLMGMLLRVSIARREEYENQQKWMLSGKTVRPGDQIFPLKLVLTSAMSRVEDFVRKLFGNPPILEVQTRQFKCETDDDELGGYSYDSDTKSELGNYGDEDDDGDALCQDTDDLESCSNQSNCGVGKIGALLALPL
ncbi:ATP-dependent RNA helicase DHX37 [Pyrus ussuriensis x Pyrus communis]|uniref:ATP-dependent RNA helicase DHX37 n=1 Tax=Pyrus ussuriensis x Pyrus communis TaxID=2448454 RepID=A0A5N5HTT0_9ROSA|nr:ATP-dependent RNA helicase DHX37 [Pyrus ussuriensis x Pyrus communis]